MNAFLTLLTGGGLAALGGLLSSLATGRREAKRDERKYTHEQAMAREARLQVRREKAYLDLLTYMALVEDWAASVRPFWGEPPAPESMTDEQHWRIDALIRANGSPEVLRLTREFNAVIHRIRAADETIAVVERSKNPSRQADDEAKREHKAMLGYREDLWKVHEAICEQVRLELRGEA
jgi:hypothetical protein